MNHITRVGSHEYNYVEQYYSNIRFCIFKSMDPKKKEEFLDMAKHLCIQIPDRVMQYPDFTHLNYAIFYANACQAHKIVELLKTHYKLNIVFNMINT